MRHKITLQKHSSSLSFLAKVFDLFLFLLAGLIAFYTQFQYWYLPPLYKIAFLIALILLIPIFTTCGVYQSLRGRSFFSYVKTLYLAIISLMIALASIGFITKTGEYFSRAWFLYWNLYAAIFLTIFRVGLRQILHAMRKHGMNQKRVVIIGSCDEVESLISQVHQALWTGFRVIEILDDGLGNDSKQVAGVIVHKIPENLNEYITKNKVDEVWLLSPSWDKDKIHNIIQSLHTNVVAIRYFPVIFGIELINHSVSEVFGLPVINIVASPMTGLNRIIKAIEDRILALIILVLISPIFALIAILVKKSSPGPIFYRQTRISWNGKEFPMLKFRSMPVNAESQTGAVWAKMSDNRATPIGTFLRKTSLDELPQFINVLKGDMSIVGPRPERPEFVERFKYEIPVYMKKHLVKAGITGWAQVNGWRGNTDLKKRIEYDLYYINHWSLWFDLKIIFLTLFKGFINKNAY